MVKKVLVLALVLMLPLPAHAAVKPGAPCKKVGQTSISKNIKYTCIKSGKKLVWDKGKKITKTTATPAASPSPTPTVTATTSPTPSPSPTESGVKALTKSEIALHNKQADCWSYMGEKVYNLTSWMAEHPGGAEIMVEMCGKDGSESFGSHHKSEVDAVLAQYYIGAIAKA